MRKLLVLLFVFVVGACSNYDDKIMGNWVDSNSNIVSISLNPVDRSKYIVTIKGNSYIEPLAQACKVRTGRDKNMIFCYEKFNYPLLTFNYNPQKDLLTVVNVPHNSQYVYKRQP